MAEITDALVDFVKAACAPRDAGHKSGTLDDAQAILACHPEIAGSDIYASAILANESAVKQFISKEPQCASGKGGPYDWDALTYLCFSRYLRIDKARSAAFVRTARLLLDAGADANTGWIEMIDHPNPRPLKESALYGAAGVAQNAELTRLLLERGADPNDEETPYHAPEGYDNAVVQVLLESGKMNEMSVACMLGRKADWHDEAGVKLILKHAADPNVMTIWGDNALHHALRRDNGIAVIKLLLDHEADPSLVSHDSRSGFAMAAYRGRADVLDLFEKRGFVARFEGRDAAVAACARGEESADGGDLVPIGGTLLAEFAGNGNVAGVRCLLQAGVKVGAVYDGDGYFEIAPNSTALHVAAWRARHAVVKELVVRGADVNALDGWGRSPLVLAVKACVDSYWKDLRSPESVEALLQAGASVVGIKTPTGYEAADRLLNVGR